MTVDTLVGVLKKRGVEKVCYFHTDHFEPWSYDISEESARAVDRMAAMARSSRYARKLSLFYSVFIPYRLNPRQAEGVRVPGDSIVFTAQRSARQERLAQDVIRPLVTADQHELHLHVHHEFWTRNTSNFDNPASQWVNAHSTPEADKARLDLHFHLCREVIARETGMPFDRWAFVHGNWALNASDPLICHVDNEMAMIMTHGGFGDFTFPAGRSYCDPKLEAPFTCLPITCPRAYDECQADPQPVGPGSGAIRADRFFIWNSPIKSKFCSIDYYSAGSRDLFRESERVVDAWLSQSVVLDRRLFLKTHAHSMKWEYKLGEPDSLIPHCLPEIAANFDLLNRICDRAGVEFCPMTVNEIMDQLTELDTPLQPRQSAPSAKGDRAIGVEPPSSIDAPLSQPPVTLEAELTSALSAWVGDDAERRQGAGDYYAVLLSSGRVLQEYESATLAYLSSKFDPAKTRIVEVGVGYGLLSLLLAEAGFEVVAFEGDERRYQGMAYLIETFAPRIPAFHERLRVVNGWFPDAFHAGDMAPRDRRNIFLTTNIVNSMSADNQSRILDRASAFDEVLIDVTRFGVSRYQPGEAEAFKGLVAKRFEPLAVVYRHEANEIWHFLPRAMADAEKNGATIGCAGSRPETGHPARQVLPAGFVHDGGVAWYVPLPAAYHDMTDTDPMPEKSRLLLLEDERPLGPGHALHKAIRERGAGLYSFWRTGLWFSTSDGSDPNVNHRVYSIVVGDGRSTP